MNVGTVTTLLGIVHEQCPVLIQLPDGLVEVKDLKRIVHDNRICFVFTPVDGNAESEVTLPSQPQVT